jgi:D-glycero-D-manno-heptose 1,7-bisphosphate phosphatase
MAVNKAIFLDKDGTLIPDIPYNVDPALITLSSQAEIGLQQMAQAGYKIIIISNQSGVAKGFFPESELKAVEKRLEALLAALDVHLDGFYYCPHHPDGLAPLNIECNCRKPKSGLLLTAAEDKQIDLSASWMIGDILNDVEAGNTAGCRTVLIDNGNETEWIMDDNRKPDLTVNNINEAAAYILQLSQDHSAIYNINSAM